MGYNSQLIFTPSEQKQVQFTFENSSNRPFLKSKFCRVQNSVEFVVNLHQNDTPMFTPLRALNKLNLA